LRSVVDVVIGLDSASAPVTVTAASVPAGSPAIERSMAAVPAPYATAVTAGDGEADTATVCVAGSGWYVFPPACTSLVVSV